MDAFQSGKHYRHRSKPSSTAPSIVNQAPCSTGLRHVKIPITEAAQLLRGLVQHVLSPAATLALSPRLDCLQALRDKTLYVGRLSWRSLLGLSFDSVGLPGHRNRQLTWGIE